MLTRSRRVRSEPTAHQALRTLERGHVVPDDYTQSFEFWRRRSANKLFPYRCKGCGSCREVAAREVASTDGCPSCGLPVKPIDIDCVLATWEPERRRILRRTKLCYALGLCLVALAILVAAAVNR